MNEPWWIDAVKAFVIINLLLLTFAYMTLVERKLIGRMQAPVRAEPRGAAGGAPADRRPDEADPEGVVLPGHGDRSPLHHGARTVRGDGAVPPSRLSLRGGWHIGDYYVSGQVADVSIGLILLFALGSVGIYGFIVGGWA